MAGKNIGARQPHKTASQLRHLPGDFLSAVGSPYLSIVYHAIINVSISHLVLSLCVLGTLVAKLDHALINMI